MRKIQFIIVLFLIYGFSIDWDTNEHGIPFMMSTDDTQMPEFKGGQTALMKYYKKELRYPPSAKKDSIQGMVVVQFTLTKEGKVQKAIVVRKVHPLLDKEALRLVCSMPDWNPARKRGMPIDTWFTLPIRFTLTNNNMNVISTIPDLP